MLLIIAERLVWGLLAAWIANKRGISGGFWWGCLLGLIGVIVVSVRTPK